MHFTSQLFTFIAGASMLANALPLDSKPRQLVPRQKSYNVINVDGGSTQPPQATTVIKATRTVEVINPGPTVTQEVTTTLVQVAPAPAPTTSSSLPTSSASSSSTSSSPSISASPPAATPKPIFVTVTVGKDDGPTEYYDNGMWHTSYRIKSFPVAVATLIISSSANATATAASA